MQSTRKYCFPLLVDLETQTALDNTQHMGNAQETHGGAYSGFYDGGSKRSLLRGFFLFVFFAWSGEERKINVTGDV